MSFSDWQDDIVDTLTEHFGLRETEAETVLARYGEDNLWDMYEGGVLPYIAATQILGS